MNAAGPDPIEFARAEEELRQERETFEQQKSQTARWFLLRLSVGYTSVAALVIVLAVCVYILMRTDVFPSSVVTAAGATLFGDVLGLVATIWKVVLSQGTVASLTPVTHSISRSRSGGSVTRGSPVQAHPVQKP
jgi:hypothetical protein